MQQKSWDIPKSFNYSLQDNYVYFELHDSIIQVYVTMHKDWEEITGIV